MIDMPWYVYLIHCSDDTLYCDVGRDTKALKRFSYLRDRHPYKIIGKRKFTRLSDAVVKCFEVRKMKRQEKAKGLGK